MPLVDDNGLAALLAAPEAERVATGFVFTEGPVWRDGALLFSDIPRSRIHRWAPGQEAVVWREPSGQSNGLALDREGRLLACEHGNRRVSRTEPDGAVVTLADRWQGKRLNSPNDIAVHSSGALYFTDPPYGVKADDRELPFQGVYRLDPDGTLALLADDFDRPNGIALSPDERVLYVDDTARQHLRAFDLTGDGGVANGRLFASMSLRAPGAADGMCVDSDGRVWCTGPGGLWCFAPDGAALGRLELPEVPANVCFGGDAGDTLYLTARTSLYRWPTRVRGA